MTIVTNCNSKKTKMAENNLPEELPEVLIKHKTIIQAVLLLTIVVEIYVIMMRTSFELNSSDLFIIITFIIFLGISMNMFVVVVSHLLMKIALSVCTGYFFFTHGYISPKLERYFGILVIQEIVSMGFVFIMQRLFLYELRRRAAKKLEEVGAVSDAIPNVTFLV